MTITKFQDWFYTIAQSVALIVAVVMAWYFIHAAKSYDRHHHDKHLVWTKMK